MQKGEDIDPFLTRVQEVRDQLVVAGVTPQPRVLVRLTPNSISEEWQVFIQSVLGKDKLLEWDRMWSDLQQEELR